MSDSGSVASSSVQHKGGLRSKAKALFKHRSKKSAPDVPPIQLDRRKIEIFPGDGSKALGGQVNVPVSVLTSSLSNTENDLSLSHPTIVSTTTSFTDISSMPNPTTVAEHQPSIYHSSNSLSATANGTPLPIQNILGSNSFAVGSVSLPPNQPPAPGLSQASEIQMANQTKAVGLSGSENPDIHSHQGLLNLKATPGVQDLKVSNMSTSSASPQADSPPIYDLWNEAYDELKGQEKTLMEEYEKIIGGEMSVIAGSTVSLSGFKMQRQVQMATFLQKKVEEAERDTWKLKFGGEKIAVKDLAEPVVGVIKLANNYIASALAPNLYASVAWSGISLLLPLVLNPSQQAASLAKTLQIMSDVIKLSKMREDLYDRCYRDNPSNDRQTPFRTAHSIYREVLKNLYTQILKLQASIVCHLSKKQAFQVGLAMINWNNWESGLSEVQKRKSDFDEVYRCWRDVRYEEDAEALEARHKENTENLEMIHASISGLQNAIEEAGRNAERTGLLNWLSDIDPSVNYNTAIGKRKDSGNNTGEWLLKDSKVFAKWQTAPNSLLWLNGKAGSGKSVLCASVVEHLRKENDSNPEIALAQFYFSFADTKKQNVVGMLSSVIKQLCCCRPDTPASVKSLFQYKTRGERPDMKSLEGMLLATMRGFTHVYVLLDALDECPSSNDSQDDEQSKLLTSLNRVREQAPLSLHLFLTSRREYVIETKLLKPATSQGHLPCLDLDLSNVQDLVKGDIAQYIDQTFQEHPFRSWADSIKEEAKSILIQKSEGMFQYVACQFDSLKRHQGNGKIRQALNGLPKGLDETYERILDEIDLDYRKQVASMLKWLAYSERPLYLDELAEIFLLDPDQSPPFDEENRFEHAKMVLGYLRGLVIKVPSYADVDSIRALERVMEIRFAHFSIQEYLRSERSLKNQSYFSTRDHVSSHLYIAESCLAYHLEVGSTNSATMKSLGQYYLWEYAARYGLKHLGKIPDDCWTPSATDHAIKIFAAQSQALLNLSRILEHDFYLDFETLGSPLYHAAQLGLFQLASQFIENGAHVNEFCPRTRWKTPLIVAAFSGNKRLVELLLENQADVNGFDEYYGNALQAEASDRNLDIVHTRSDHKSDTEIRASTCRTALQAAGYNGSQEIVQLLLNHNADVNIEGGIYGTALQAAAFNGSQEIVQLLLNHKADVNIEGGRYGTALQAAAFNGSQEIVQLLLNHKADANIEGGRYGTALQAAAFNGSQEIVQLLLNHKADVNIEGGEHGTALQAAAYKGSQEIVQLLLNHKADVNIEGGGYGTALQAAAYKGSQEIVQLLLNHKADVNIEGGGYGTALQAAAFNGSQEIVQLLLNHKADANIEGGGYGTALQAAAFNGSQEIVQLLLNHKADINIEGGGYGTALQAAAFNRSQEIVQLLLNHKADINIEGGRYGTALQAAAFNGSQEIVQLLLNHKADVNIEGGRYGTALHAAASEGHLDIVQLLLEPGRGTNLNANGGYFGNALQGAISSDTKNGVKVAKLLLSCGAQVDPPGEEWEALLTQIEKGYEGDRDADILRKFQKDPTGYIERREKALEEESNVLE